MEPTAYIHAKIEGALNTNVTTQQQSQQQHEEQQLAATCSFQLRLKPQKS